MRFNEKDRLAKIYIESKRIRNKNINSSFNTMVDMNNSVINLCISSIKAKNPKITEKDLIKRLHKIVGLK